MLRQLAAALLLVTVPVSGAMANEGDSLVTAEEMAPAKKLSERLRENLNGYSNDVAGHLSLLSVGLLDMHFDLHQKQARVHLGGGDPEAFRLRIDSDVRMTGSNARIQTKIDLAVVGHRLRFEVPEFDMNTRSIAGGALQLSLPLLEGKF